MTDLLTIPVPASKSATQRALILAALAPGESRLHHALECDDSRHLRDSLGKLGIRIIESGSTWSVQGGTFTAPSDTLFCGNAGTTIRFLAALAPSLNGAVTLDAGPQLRQRPLHDVMSGLHALGCHVLHLDRDGFAPLRITPQMTSPRTVRVDTTRTSQFLSGLLMAGQQIGLESLRTNGDVISRPYIDLTLSMMSLFGQEASEREPGHFDLPKAAYSPSELSIEGDWSSAAMLLVAARLAKRSVRIPNLNDKSIQGDRKIVEFLDRLDRAGDLVFDLSACPDLLPPLAVACLFSNSPSSIKNVEHARIKESDRIAATADMIRAVGGHVEEKSDGLRIIPAPTLHLARIEDHDDHRMAMASGLLSLRIPGVTTSNPDCVSKSWPGFWNVLEEVRQ
jgi:3-phosphoshikimate 1-carboxyvinyltransferase